MTLIERAQQWANGAKIISEWLGSGADTVPGRHAQDRANTCLKCPLNVRDFAFPEAVAAAVRRQVEIKNRLELRVNGEKSLHTCSGCGCVLRLKVWLPINRLGVAETELDNFDPSCWMRKEIKP